MKAGVLMVGTALDGQGGVASVLRTWRDSGLFERWQVHYVTTNGKGGGLRKLRLAVSAWLQCIWTMAFCGVGLVHVHTSSYLSFWRKTPVFAAALLMRKPLVVSLHGGAFRDFYAARSWLGKAWIRLVMRRALRFVVLTAQWQRWALATEPGARVCVIPNPVPYLPEKLPEASDCEAPLLLFLGRVERDKGVFVLLEALARAKAAGAAWQLVCGGNGDLDGARRAADALGLQHHDVQFLGWIDGDAKRHWLERCTLLVLPSFVENMPVAILEAFAFGKAVIATRVGGVPDVVSDSQDGFLVEPRDVATLCDALVRAHSCRDCLQRMGLHGRAKAEVRYASAKVASLADSLYQDIIAARSVRPDETHS